MALISTDSIDFLLACASTSRVIRLFADAFHTVLLIVSVPDFVLTSSRLREYMRRRQQRRDRKRFDPDDVIDGVLGAVRRADPVRDHRVLVIAWRQDRRMTFESITAPLEDVDYVDLDGGLAFQVSYRRGRGDIGEVENTVPDCQRCLRRKIR